jgi:hypothetical protein
MVGSDETHHYRSAGQVSANRPHLTLVDVFTERRCKYLVQELVRTKRHHRRHSDRQTIRPTF